MDREKVIKGLRDIGAFIAGRIGFEQARNFLRTIDETIELLKEQDDMGKELTDAIELIHKKNERIEKLLKDQEAVKPKSKVRHGSNGQIQHWCGNCMTMLHGKPKYCSNCGREQKWE